ncbi:MAG: DNA polymerase III subunit gamma/tau, partial [Gammaproteobacteria bacterium]
MTYQVLANKWRPKDFTEVVSQVAAVTILENSLDSQKLHHAYLFTGTRGVGKTTIARIFAKALICERGISANPCNSCNFCVEVNQGHCLDVIEIDAASRTKVEDTRAILDNLAYAPTKARFKIYIIDEIHMLSNHSFNALLKSLEEPPKHIKFILATTDPQKLPITILSRCLQLKLKLLPVNAIINQLEKILVIENKVFEKEGLLQLAIAANGSMRDALSLLEQVLAFSDNLPVITYAAVIQALNLPDEVKTINLLKSVILSDVNMVIGIIED